METCSCNLNYLCSEARELMRKENMAYRALVKTTPLKVGLWTEYELASRLRKEHRTEALDGFE